MKRAVHAGVMACQLEQGYPAGFDKYLGFIKTILL